MDHELWCRLDRVEKISGLIERLSKMLTYYGGKPVEYTLKELEGLIAHLQMVIQDEEELIEFYQGKIDNKEYSE